jgi:fermentation-respiration switch protein FrsA (DUF1100 family)
VHETHDDPNGARLPGAGLARRGLLRLTGAALTILNIPSAKAQDMSNGAANFYTSDRVTVQKVAFRNQYRMNVAGNLFTPAGFDRGATTPALVVGHPMGAVKEQSANLYATKMAEQGFVTLSIDLPFWGESEGEPRNLVAPDAYTEAFNAAVDFLGTRPFVDRNRIGAIGVCGSGSFVISAAKIDPRLRAVATVSMYDMGAATRHALNRSQTLEQRREIIAAAAEQRYAEFTGGETRYTGGTVHELTPGHPPDPARVLRFLPHTARRIHVVRPVAAPHDASDADQQCQVHELLPLQRHRDDLAAPDALHHR